MTTNWRQVKQTGEIKEHATNFTTLVLQKTQKFFFFFLFESES